MKYVKLFESPDLVEIGDKWKLKWDDSTAFAFGYYKDKMRISNPGETHFAAYLETDFPKFPTHIGRVSSAVEAAYWEQFALPIKLPGDAKTPRELFKTPGRIWPTSKVISFWTYPETYDELGKIIGDINDAYDERYNDIWSKDINFNSITSININDDWFIETADRLIRIRDYVGSGRWSDDELRAAHQDRKIGDIKRKQDLEDRLDQIKRGDASAGEDAQRIFGGSSLKARKNPIWLEQSRRTSENVQSFSQWVLFND